jgi:hypothetical protein
MPSPQWCFSLTGRDRDRGQENGCEIGSLSIAQSERKPQAYAQTFPARALYTTCTVLTCFLGDDGIIE